LPLAFCFATCGNQWGLAQDLLSTTFVHSNRVGQPGVSTSQIASF
jgi:hypothetical protein